MALGWLWWRASCVAGVALAHINLGFEWQVWHLLASSFVFCGTSGDGLALVALGPPWSPMRSPRIGWQAWRLLTSTLAGTALGGIQLRFLWQAWHLVTLTLRGTRSTCW